MAYDKFAAVDSSTLLFPPTVRANLAQVSPNLVINGGFDIWQRGTSTITGIANAAFHPDRWFVITDGVGNVNSSRVDVASQGIGSQYAWRLERTAGTSRWVGIHIAEGALTQVGKTVTLSVYLRKGSALTTNVVLDISTRSAKFGAVADSSNITIPNSSISTTNFTRFSVSLPVTTATSSANADLFEIEIVAASQAGASNAFFDIAGVQLEVGDAATPFRRNANSIQGELAACQRYLPVLYGMTSLPGYSYATNQGISTFVFPVTPRTKPTSITVSAASDFTSFNSTNTGTLSPTIALNIASINSASIIWTSTLTAGTPARLEGNNDNGRIFFNGCEL